MPNRANDISSSGCAGAAARRGTVASVDFLEVRVPAGSEVVGIDLETAALLAFARRL
jgi:hypothetical protein